MSHLTCRREDPVPDIHMALKEAQNAIEVILGLEKLLAVAVVSRGMLGGKWSLTHVMQSKKEEGAVSKYEQFIKILQDLILMKLDHVCTELLLLPVDTTHR